MSMDFYRLLFSVLYMKLIPLLCLVGFVLNAVALLTLGLSRSLKGTIYTYLLAKTFFEWVILAIGALIPYGNCAKCSGYGSQVYNLYMSAFVLNSFYFCSACIEIAIIVDKYLTLANVGAKSTWRSLCSAKLVVLGVACSGTLLFIPMMFAAQIVKIDQKSPSKFVFLFVGAKLASQHFMGHV